MVQQLTCRKCLKAKDITEFHAGRIARRDKTCKDCVRLYNKQYREKNSEYFVFANKEWVASNKDKVKKLSKEYSKTYYYKNKEAIAKKQSQRRLNNPEYYSEYRKSNKSKINARNAKRRALQLKATPKWLTDIDFERMANAYKLAELQTKLTGSQWHVDHFYALKGKEVCGLHVPNNLRVIPWLENVKKGNRLT